MLRSSVSIRDKAVATHAGRTPVALDVVVLVLALCSGVFRDMVPARLRDAPS